jgi:ASCH domain
MKALSVLQPWAQLLVLGHKRYEFRSWKTQHRGPLLIHAGLRFPDEARALCQLKPIRALLAEGGFDYPSDLHLGALLGSVHLEDCLPTEQVLFENPDDMALTLGDCRPGQWAWQMSCPEAWPTPIPYQGKLGLFEIVDLTLRVRTFHRAERAAYSRSHMNIIKSRIVEHVKVRARELVPHELNPRRHPPEQREALNALYEEIGFARSVLAYRQADGRLKLIDGHLRQSMDPDMEIDVEVLDVNDDEARQLLLSLDPLAELADYDDRCLQELQSLTQSSSNTMNALWANIRRRDAEVMKTLHEQVNKSRETIPEAHLVLIDCASEEVQTDLLRRLTAEGFKCRALNT